jgi:hypothetical protein
LWTGEPFVAVRNVIEVVSRSGCAWKGIAVECTVCGGGRCPQGTQTLIPDRNQMKMMRFMHDRALQFTLLDAGLALVEVSLL